MYQTGLYKRNRNSQRRAERHRTHSYRRLVIQQHSANRSHQTQIATNPDVTPRNGWVRIVLILIYTSIGIAVLAYLLSPLLGNPRTEVEVALVAKDMDLVHAITDGLFVACEPLPPGTLIEAGQLLGRIEAPGLSRDIQDLARTEADLKRQLLRLDMPFASGTHEELDRQAAIRAMEARIAQTQSRLKSLREIDLDVVAPVAGRVHFGLALSKAVKKDEEFVAIWQPARGLVLEITGPEAVINELLRKEQLVAEFATPEGPVEMIAEPAPASRRSFQTRRLDGKTVTRATMQCRPVAIPEAINAPDWAGRLL